MSSVDDPERCEKCGGRGKVVESRHEGNYRRRRRQCPKCGHTWTSYESRLNVQPVIAKVEQRRAAVAAASADHEPRVPSPEPPPPAPAKAPAPPPRRVTRSPYIG